MSPYRLWVNEARTVLVRLWDSGVVEVATREETWHTWGPPTICDEEKIAVTASPLLGEPGEETPPGA